MQDDGIDGKGRKENQRLSLPYLIGTDFLQPVSLYSDLPLALCFI